MFSAITSNLSQELSEQLRLVLEPTQASRLKGDFRTGRRINMRKVSLVRYSILAHVIITKYGPLLTQGKQEHVIVLMN